MRLRFAPVLDVDNPTLLILWAHGKPWTIPYNLSSKSGHLRYTNQTGHQDNSVIREILGKSGSIIFVIMYSEVNWMNREG